MENKEVSSVVRPSIPLGGHPVETGDYIIDTIAINEILEPMRQWIQMRIPGAVVYGAPRLGKTRAIKYIQNVFNYKYPNQWLNLKIKTRKRKTPNEDAFFEFFLKDVGHDLHSQGKAIAKRNRLTNYLLDKGDQTVRKQIVLFIDDAQRLSTIEYEWLMDVYNELDTYGITLTTILIGQTELAHRRSSYLNSAKQIVGRFMVHEKRFYGVKEIEELSYLLSSYDEVTEFPIGSSCSYTNFFFPVAFGKGHRFEKEATYIWSSLIELRAENGINKKLEIPMHYLISIINHVLLEYGANSENYIEWPTKALWKDAICVSGYINAEVLQSLN